MRQSTSITAGAYMLSNDDVCDTGLSHVLQIHAIHPRTISNPVEGLLGTPINDHLESRVLGPGKADGVIIRRKIDRETCERREWQLWQFDDNNNAFPSNSKEGCKKKGTLSSSSTTATKIDAHVLMVATGDGCSEGNRALGGFGTKPLGNGYLKINEAPILEKEGAFKRWLRMNDKMILAFRKRFVQYLSEYIGHQFSENNVEFINNDLLHQTTVVGTENFLYPYEITQDANLRVLISKASDDSVKSYRGARVHEVRFLFAVGSGGSFGDYNSTQKKYFYSGAEIAWGFYIIENVFKAEEVHEDLESLVLEFQSKNLWNPTPDLHNIVDREIVEVYQMRQGLDWSGRKRLKWGRGRVEGTQSVHFSGNKACANIKLFFSM